MTLAQIYRESIKELELNQIDTAQLDAKVICKFVLNLNETKLFQLFDSPISEDKIAKIRQLITRRAKNEPVAYITNHKEFYGLDFYINKNVLIPRPETEALIEKSLDFIRSRSTVNGQRLTMIDVGTGSGNIIISLYKSLITDHFPLSTIFYASDISAKALEVAQKNAKLHNAEKINFIQSDLFSNIDQNLKFDLVLANLPYVPKDGKPLTVNRSPIDFEPAHAIFADDNGATIIKEFLVQAKTRINQKGLILIELDPRNALDIKKFAQNIYSDAQIVLSKDLAGFDRYLEIELN